MLSSKSIKEFAVKLQTTEINIAREYFQHLFLSNLYQIKNSDTLAFKGGTALRIIYGSPRFSEDIDFNGATTAFHIKSVLSETLKKIELEGIECKANESKETSGGYIALYETLINDLKIRIELNISLRKKNKQNITKTHLVIPLFYPTYSLIALDENEMIKEKIEALLYRQKPRDYFDLYYILRSRIGVRAVIPFKTLILKNISNLDLKYISRELKIYLPKSYWNIINNLSDILHQELMRL